MRRTSRIRRLIVFAAALLATSGVGVVGYQGVAHAIIGRPLTPLSFAGVARRTTRRAVYGGAYGYGYGGYGYW
jgi:hypothetical protein